MSYHLGVEYMDLSEVLGVCNVDITDKSKDEVALLLTNAIMSYHPNSIVIMKFYILI